MRSALDTAPAGMPRPPVASKEIGPLRLSRPAQLAAVKAYIESHLESSRLTPGSTARALGISVRQLHILFRPTGTTFSRFVLMCRLQAARSVLLQEPERNVLDIALDCGIDSSTVFYRAFRAVVGMTPTDFRRAALAEKAEAESAAVKSAAVKSAA